MVVSLMPLAVLFGSFVVAETQNRGCSRDFMCYFVDMPVTIRCVHYACTRNYAYYTGQISEGICSCSYNGVTYKDGENFTVVIGSKCMNMRCSNKEWSHQSWGCVSDSKCYLVGEPVYNKCSKYVCKKIRQAYGYYLQPVSHSTCCKRRWERNKYMSGQNDTIFINGNCVVSRCNDGEWDLIARGCSVNGKCYLLGHHLLKDCSTLRCSMDTRNVQLRNPVVIMKRHCQAGDKCHRVGSQFYMNGCDRHICTRKTQNVVGPELIKQGCPDYNGVCHELNGFGLTWEIHGHLRTNCSCRALSNGTVTYTCL